MGDGALVEAAVARARSVEGGGCHLRVFACDVDANALRHVRSKVPLETVTRLVDFLQLDPSSTGQFDGVIANPPFTRNHALEPDWRRSLRAQFRVSGAAGLWVYFLLHALDFLAKGGRLAAVVPASALFTNYGRDALRRLADRFARVELRRIVGKPIWVNATQERGALVLASGYGEGCAELSDPVLWSTNKAASVRRADCDTAYAKLEANSAPLESIATLRIGVVTGCNAVFLMNEDERLEIGIEGTEVVPVVGRARQVPGLLVSSAALIARASQGDRTWLLTPASLGPRGSPVRKQLARISHRKRTNTLWFKKRKPWWRVQLGPASDGVFTYMNDLGPRLVLADAKVRSTNTLHQVLFHPGVTRPRQIAAALTMISTFGQLAAERVGRSYGGGVLKFELCEARRMPVLPPTDETLDASFREADLALRSGDLSTARNTADEAILYPILGSDWSLYVDIMELELERLRSIRRGTAA